jgi:hypothetical protein
MNFKEATENTPGLETKYKVGLQALRAEDKTHIRAEDTRRLTGSIDVDSAYREADPDGNRWDFAIAYLHTNRKTEYVYWVELHTAMDSEVKVVIKKAAWLLQWLKTTGILLATFEREILWVSSGVTRLTLSAPQRKQMAEVGLQQRGSILDIPKKRHD